MKTYKTIPFNLLLIHALAKDFNKQLTWQELYDNLYIKNTDIYYANIATLKHWKIQTNQKISQKQVQKIIQNNIVIFQMIKNNETTTLTNTKNNESYQFSKIKTINIALAKLGYTQKIK